MEHARLLEKTVRVSVLGGDSNGDGNGEDDDGNGQMAISIFG